MRRHGKPNVENFKIMILRGRGFLSHFFRYKMDNNEITIMHHQHIEIITEAVTTLSYTRTRIPHYVNSAPFILVWNGANNPIKPHSQYVSTRWCAK